MHGRPGTLFAALWLASCAGAGTFEISLTFPDAASRAETAEVFLWALAGDAEDCQALVAGALSAEDLSILATVRIDLQEVAGQTLRQVPAGPTLFLGEGRTAAGARILRGCAAAEVEGGGHLEVIVALQRVCTPSLDGEQPANELDDDCDGLTDECEADSDCLDDNPCTSDFCALGACHHTPYPDEVGCTDLDPCTLEDRCASGACRGTTKDCSALAGPCVVGQCDPASGLCAAVPVSDGEICDDGLACTEQDACAAGVCLGPDRDCDDGDACTQDSCDQADGQCDWTWQPRPGLERSDLPGSCDNGLDDDCDGLTDGADASCGSCNLASDCDDGEPCTEDDCVASSCTHLPLGDGADCDDGLGCTEGDTCQAGRCTVQPLDCGAYADACNQAVCEEPAGTCRASPRPNGYPCDDADACTTGDACQAGACTAVPLDCNDGVGCTEDVCAPLTGVCQHVLHPTGREGYLGEPSCANELDDDCDGLTDQADPDCCQPQTLATLNCVQTSTCQVALCDDLALLLHFDQDPEWGEDPAHAFDFSGQGNDARCFAPNCPTWLEAGSEFGGAYDFGGSQRFEIPHHASLASTTQVTVAVRFRPETLPSGYRSLVTKDQTSPERSNYWVGHDGNRFCLYFNNGAFIGGCSAQTFAPGAWYNLVLLMDFENGQFDLLVHGSNVFHLESAEQVEADLGPVWIGYNPNDQGPDGLIDEAAIWTRLLTPEEIIQLWPMPTRERRSEPPSRGEAPCWLAPSWLRPSCSAPPSAPTPWPRRPSSSSSSR